jgi:hypothetical protein
MSRKPSLSAAAARGARSREGIELTTRLQTRRRRPSRAQHNIRTDLGRRLGQSSWTRCVYALERLCTVRGVGRIG